MTLASHPSFVTARSKLQDKLAELLIDFEGENGESDAALSVGALDANLALFEVSPEEAADNAAGIATVFDKSVRQGDALDKREAHLDAVVNAGFLTIQDGDAAFAREVARYRRTHVIRKGKRTVRLSALYCAYYLRLLARVDGDGERVFTDIETARTADTLAAKRNFSKFDGDEHLRR